MTRKAADRSGVLAALALWLAVLLGVALLGFEVTAEVPKRWLGHWITILWALTGWLPVLILARRPGGRG